MNDIDTLSKALKMYNVDFDNYPLAEKVIVQGELLTYIESVGDNPDNLYKIDLNKSKKYHTKLKTKVDDNSYFIYSKLDLNKTYYTDYKIQAGLLNQGTGTNPDSSKAHIGVYGGQYAWKQK